jgi:adenylylsulfate kinase-like enzyme
MLNGMITLSREKKEQKPCLIWFTGIDSAYQVLIDPEIVIDTVELSIEEAAQEIYDYLSDHAYILSA